MQPSIRLARRDDVARLRTLVTSSSGILVHAEDSWSEDELRHWIASARDVVLCADINNRVVGVCLSHHHVEAHKVHVENIVVEAAYRRQGLGRTLLRGLFDEYARRGASELLRFVALVNQDNSDALSFFESVGFGASDPMVWYQRGRI